MLSPTPHPPSAAQLTLSAEKLFYDIASCAPSSSLLTHFSQPPLPTVTSHYGNSGGGGGGGSYVPQGGSSYVPQGASMGGAAPSFGGVELGGMMQGSSPPVVLEHSFSTCASPGTYRFTGLHAVRSYFDLLKTHYEAQREWRVVEATAGAPSAAAGGAATTAAAGGASSAAGAGRGREGASSAAGRGSAAAGRVTILGTTRWTWRTSRQSWTEHWTAYLEFDGAAKVRSFVVITTSGEETCVMRAVDPGRGGGAASVNMDSGRVNSAAVSMGAGVGRAGGGVDFGAGGGRAVGAGAAAGKKKKLFDV
ncbi:hypothetical protein CYLTODRAFT_418334 [Cylindrobasidium torrendii FP15055 ss-10]|uniref:Uncharacterized protein n=1 Tax=Cylindrobasidium torrendii FP15055 ss-10 TaxID=1314674 RepID=A0A0D7BQR9_9AGAR|nr:hypothetical protein CYLTODRAFT_418334 [Cylindrobasidium torrendii FP15055 ss-10]